MKCPSCISLLLCCIFGLAACTGPVILDEEEKTEAEQGSTVPVRDSVPIIHEGTYDSPYTIAEAQTLGHGKSVWIEGYIVGCVSGSMKNGCNYTRKATTLSNILLADTFPTGTDYDYLYCLPVELPNNSAERDDLNIYDNPDNYHRKVRIEGDITLYYNVVGLKGGCDYSFTDEIENEDEDEEIFDDEEPEIQPDTPNDPDATRQDTLSIAEGIKRQSEKEYNQVYIKGYVVGYYNNSYIRFNPSIEDINTLARNNIVLADNINERDEYNVIIVDLPTGTALREQVNLKDNPQNLYHMLTVKGKMTKFRETNYHGCMETLSKYLDDEDYYFSIE